MGCFGKRQVPVLTDDQQKILHEMESLAAFMDTSWLTICGTSFGADAIIGLIPGLGDVATCGVSLWIVVRAWFAFDPIVFRRAWFIMLMNCGIDFCIGAVPLAGDILDIYWKSNVKNVNLVRAYYGMEPMPPPPTKEEIEEEKRRVKEAEKEEKRRIKEEKRMSRKSGTKVESRSIPEDLEDPVASESLATSGVDASTMESKV